MASQDLRTVRQILELYPAFTESSIRKHVFFAASNGLAPGIARIGRRVLIDVKFFDRWLDQQRMQSDREVAAVSPREWRRVGGRERRA